MCVHVRRSENRTLIPAHTARIRETRKTYEMKMERCSRVLNILMNELLPHLPDQKFNPGKYIGRKSFFGKKNFRNVSETLIHIKLDH